MSNRYSNNGEGLCICLQVTKTKSSTRPIRKCTCYICEYRAAGSVQRSVSATNNWWLRVAMATYRLISSHWVSLEVGGTAGTLTTDIYVNHAVRCQTDLNNM